MPNLVRLDRKIQRARGKAAAKAGGQYYSVYRLISGVTSGSVVSGYPVYTNFRLRLDDKASKAEVENQTFDLLAYAAICDGDLLEKQDVLVESGYQSDGGTWIVAQQRPTRELIVVRAETTCFITRQGTDAGAAVQQPTEGAVYQPGYGGTRIGNEKYLVLSNGLYSFSTSATVGASVPCGLQPLNRVRDGKLPQGAPTRQPESHHLAYVPLLPGVTLEVDDIINADAGDRYKVMESHSTGLVGFSGYVAVVNRIWN